MKLAICLLTCGRPELTKRTVYSLHQVGLPMPALENALLLSGHDGNDHEGERIAYNAGFSSVYKPFAQRGVIAGMRALIAAASHRGAGLVLWLENDWEFVRPIPFGAGLSADCVRLYGAQKQADGAKPTGGRNMATGEPIEWRPAMGLDGWEGAAAHFGGPPSIVRVDRILPHLGPATNLNDLSRRAGSLSTLRPVENIVFHIGGEVQTPNFKC